MNMVAVNESDVGSEMRGLGFNSTKPKQTVLTGRFLSLILEYAPSLLFVVLCLFVIDFIRRGYVHFGRQYSTMTSYFGSGKRGTSRKGSILSRFTARYTPNMDDSYVGNKSPKWKSKHSKPSFFLEYGAASKRFSSQFLRRSTQRKTRHGVEMPEKRGIPSSTYHGSSRRKSNETSHHSLRREAFKTKPGESSRPQKRRSHHPEYRGISKTTSTVGALVVDPSKTKFISKMSIGTGPSN